MLTDFTKKLVFGSLLLWAGIAAVLVYGDQVHTTVEDFTLEDKSVSPYTQQMIFEFNRSVDTSEMEKTFSITPQVDTEISWVGKKMVASFKETLTEGEDYKVTLGDYVGSFNTREKELFYIDSGSKTRQIFSYNLATAESEAITPEDLLVTSYQLSDDGNLMVFFGTPADQVSDEDDYSVFPNLYSLDLETGQLSLLSEKNDQTLNMAFKLSPDGETILLNILHLAEDGAPAGVELLISQDGEKFKPFWKQGLNGLTEGSIYFTADSQFIIAYDWNRFKILPIKQGSYPEQDLGDYVRTLGFNDLRNKLLFLKWKDDNLFAPSNELVVYDENGGREITATDLGVIEDAVISNAGDLVVLVLEEITGNDFGVYTFDTSSNQLTRLDSNNLLTEINLDLAKDEEWVAYEAQLDPTEDGGGEVWIVNLQTQKSLMITRDGRLPRWRP